jgi:hypothetical protein
MLNKFLEKTSISKSNHKSISKSLINLLFLKVTLVFLNLLSNYIYKKVH